jgi:hypothetical protein
MGVHFGCNVDEFPFASKEAHELAETANASLRQHVSRGLVGEISGV